MNWSILDAYACGVNNTSFCAGWRQIRIFSRWTHLWYTSLLGRSIKPVLAAHPDSAFFFSMYQCPLGMDDGDTCIAELPREFLAGGPAEQMHMSVRFRFRAETRLEHALSQAIQGNPSLWTSGFLPYCALSDLGGSRFTPRQLPPDRAHRAQLVAEVLNANCRIILDALEPVGADFQLEQNQQPNNQMFQTSGQSVLHMLGNPWVHRSGQVIPLYVLAPSGPARV